MSDQTENQSSELLRLLAPYLAGAVLVSVAIGFALPRLVPSIAPPVSVAVVSFDVIKYANAQRAVASTFIKKDADIAAANEVLLDLPARTREAIQSVAGPGALVVVKQAVVQGQTADITDEVLKKLGLPTNVPTADATAYTLDVAPTGMFGVPVAPRRQDSAPVTGPVVLP